MLRLRNDAWSVLVGAELMRLLMWVTPAGTVDEGGVMQPSYLNFDTTLLAAPLGNEMSVRIISTPHCIFPHNYSAVDMQSRPLQSSRPGSTNSG